MAVHCQIQNSSLFARKNYFYPDLPKGYQITQYEEPLATDGWLEIKSDSGSPKRVGITRIHLEEDAGKAILGETLLWDESSSAVFSMRGKEKVFGYLMGRVIDESGGSANPGIVQNILNQKLIKLKNEETSKSIS
jgi:Asp-tRNA(Asn)/Glu-tRNA(Gln) amidotransferase B subunit